MSPCLSEDAVVEGARTLRSFQQIWFWFFLTRTYVSTHLQLTSSKCANRPRACGTYATSY